jgi:hypothetical protein
MYMIEPKRLMEEREKISFVLRNCILLFFDNEI